MARPEESDARFERIESRLDTLTRTIDDGFAGVDQAFADQRRYTDFVFDRLQAEMHERFGQVDRRFEQIDGRFEQVDGRFEQVGGQVGRLERKIDWIIEHLSNGSS